MRYFFLALSLSLFLWTGCSSSLTVSYVGTPDMNNGGNAAVVKVYQLSADGNFSSAPLSAFWRDDQGTLGTELVRPPRKVTLYPSEQKTVTFELAEKTKFLGVAANLREPDREQWRSIHSVEGMGDEVAVTVETSQIAVDVEKGRSFSLGLF